MSEEATKEEGSFKIKKKPTMKKLGKPNEVTKINLPSKPPVVETEATKVVIPSVKVEDKKPDAVESEAIVEDKKEEIVEEEQFTQIQEITEDEEEEVKKVSQEIKEAIRDERVSGKPLPENVEKLISFMEEVGGTVEDYVRLNADYSKVDNNTLLKEYYKKKKPHLDEEEINFLLDDNFSFDEDLDEEREVRKKKLAFKEEVAEAKSFLEDLKGKYYDEIKLRPGVSQEQKKATDFFNRYNEEQNLSKQRKDRFKKATSELLNDNFKGFEYNIGEKKFRYGVNNPTKIAEQQSDMSNFIGKFLNDKGEVSDQQGYHKAMYAAENMDKIASHFYEQGKADAVKDVVNSSKNISDTPRQTSSDSVFINGLKVKSVNGMDSSKLKIKKSRF